MKTRTEKEIRKKIEEYKNEIKEIEKKYTLTDEIIELTGFIRELEWVLGER